MAIQFAISRKQCAMLLACAVGMICAGSARAGDEIVFDATKAVPVRLPAARGEQAVAFRTDDGKEGWVRQVSNEALPTPAYSKGKLFTGGGYSSRVFVALNAANGKQLWTMATQDNGPTSPVVTDKYVAYNTESCHTEVRDDEGNLVWSEVTGGTLLTQPVIADGLLVIPHPIMARSADVADNHFRMLSVDLKNFKHGWDADMTTDVLSAPVAAAGRVYFACTDGRLFCVKGETGGEEWHVVANATSAPVVVGKMLAITTEERAFNRLVVGIRRYNIEDGALQDAKPLATTAVLEGDANMARERGWDYQGPKLAYANKRLFNAPGNMINAVNLEDGKVAWRVIVKGDGLNNGADSLTPPAMGKEQLYIGSKKGHVLALKQSDGSVTSAYKFSEALTSQPVLAEGNIYFGTASGKMVCLKLGEKDASGWHAWGGDAQHNKVE